MNIEKETKDKLVNIIKKNYSHCKIFEYQIINGFSKKIEFNG